MLANALFSADLVSKEAAEGALEDYVEVSWQCVEASRLALQGPLRLVHSDSPSRFHAVESGDL